MMDLTPASCHIVISNISRPKEAQEGQNLERDKKSRDLGRWIARIAGLLQLSRECVKEGMTIKSTIVSYVSSQSLLHLSI